MAIIDEYQIGSDLSNLTEGVEAGGAGTDNRYVNVSHI
jgi:hypothetical protein